MKRFAVLFVTTTYLFVTSQLRGAAGDNGRVIKPDRADPLPLRLESEQGVFVVNDAAVSLTDRDPREGYVGWWLGAADPQVYVYAALLYHTYNVIGALIDLSEQFEVDLDALTADASAALRKQLLRELERREANQSRERERPVRQNRDGEGAELNDPLFGLPPWEGKGGLFIDGGRGGVGFGAW